MYNVLSDSKTQDILYLYKSLLFKNELKHFMMKIREDYYRFVKGKFLFILQKACFINIWLAFTYFNVDILYYISNTFYPKMLKHI